MPPARRAAVPAGFRVGALAPVADSPRYRFVQGDICRAADLDDVVFLGDDLGEDAGGGGGDLGVDLVGRHLKQWLILLDRVSLLLQPAGDCPLGNALSECGHLDGDGHGF